MDETYEVGYPGNVLEHFRALAIYAKQTGRVAEFVEAGRIIHVALRSNPRQFGDPTYPLRASHQDMYSRAVNPLMVHYAVHRTRRVVIVKSIEWMSTMKS